jgi:HIV Tat-specific factor 1
MFHEEMQKLINEEFDEENEEKVDRSNSVETKENKLLGHKRNHSNDIVKILDKKDKKKQKQKEKKRNKWYEAKINSNVYVSGLPKDITDHELSEFFSKCGFIRKDEKTGESKVKLYKDETGKFKGDALISFIREESVIIAIDLFNDTEIRPGYKIKVEKAKFEQKGNYKTRESYKIDELQRYKHKTDVNRLLGWDEDDSKGLKIIILKNMFNPAEFFV